MLRSTPASRCSTLRTPTAPRASEELLGEALGSRRDDVIVATKFGSDMEGVNGRDFGARGSRRYVQIAVEASLRRLRTDRIDLLQMHEPDPITPIEETLSALDDLVHAGKVRYLGSSNVSGWQIADAEWTARTSGFERFVSVQNEYSLLERGIEDEVIPACEEYGIGVLPFPPRAGRSPQSTPAAADHGPASNQRTWLRTPTMTRSRAFRTTPASWASTSSTLRSAVSPLSRPSRR